MKKILCLLFTLGMTCSMFAADMVSPNAKIKVVPESKGCKVYYQQQQVLNIPVLGNGGSQIQKVSKAHRITADYQMLTGKRLHCTNEANEYHVALAKNVRLVMRLYNDGIAFRYEYTNLKNSKAPAEKTAYLIPEGTKRWMMQWSDGYEGFYPMSTTAKVKTLGGFGGSVEQKDINTHWGYPLLMEAADDVFALITEANIEKMQSASSLFNKGEVFSVVPDQNDLKLTGDWHTPWRVVIIGSLADVVQSTLVTDVSEPAKIADASWIHPGAVSWVYWAYNHGSNDYNIIKKYVDMAGTLHLPYVLIDAEWDEMKDGKTIEDAVNYAKSKGVKPLIWYNSSIGWVNGAPGPKFRLNKPEDREKEFAWCEKIGVAGVKIDFFSGDNQQNMDYCIDLLESAAKHHLLVNFHGAPIPRGWQRTYPNLMSTEGVYGAEWYNNVPTFTKKAAAHNATLPFTRNVIGPMDYTPCAFSDSQHPHITSHAHELALTILFESGLQHLADRPESYLAQPQDVKQFLSSLPTVWDETRLLSGYPGESVVMARRSGKTWYIAGINGTDDEKTLPLDLSFLDKRHGDIMLFGDGGERSFNISLLEDFPKEMKCRARGGFVLVVHPYNDPLSVNMPLFQTKYTADPSPIVVGDTLFLFTSHDASPEDIPDENERNAAGFFMYDWLLWSTTDMVNWTEHGAVASLKEFKWRSRDNGAWAIQTVERNGKYYLYAPLHGHGIGVLVADSPYGPFRDPLGEPLVWQKEHWDDIDPSVFIDDDGQAYMYWGNPHVYCIKLNEDMISTKGDILVVNPQDGVMRPVKEEGAKANLRVSWSEKANWTLKNYQEGPWFYKRNGHYYLAYATTCCPEALGYAMSDSPTGPWVWKNYIMSPTQRDRGNHPGICDYKGHSYVFGQNYDLMHLDTYVHHERRTVSAQEITYNADGTIQEIPYWLNQKPIKQLHWLNPYRRVEAETMAWGYGLKTAKMGIENTGVIKDMPESTGKKNMYVFDINDGEFIRLRGVDFETGARMFSINAASTGFVEMTLRLDNQDGPVIGTVKIGMTGSVDAYKSFATKVKKAAGVHDLYICFDKASGDIHLDYWEFKK